MRATTLLGLACLAGCLDFTSAEAQFCAARPDLCGDAGQRADAGPVDDAGSTDAGSTDAGSADAGSTDAGSADAGSADAGSTDAGSTDAGRDAGGLDGGSPDAGSPDAGDLDAGGEDAGLDASLPDAGVDAGRIDAGPPVCGDTRTEPPEVCDDGNTSPGDGCDPTCRYFNRWSLLSGIPGTQGYADSTVGVGARFAYAIAITTDDASLFVADRTNRAIREIEIDSGVTTTMFGGPGVEVLADGGSLRAPIDLEYHTLADGGPGALYILEVDSTVDAGRVLRVDFFDPPGFRTMRQHRSDVPSARAIALGYLGAFERVITFTDFGLQESRVLPQTNGFGSSGTLANTAQLESLAGSRCHDVTFIGGMVNPDGTYASSRYLVTCETALLSVSSTGGAPVVVSGATTAGCADGTTGATSRLTRAIKASWEGGTTAVFVDQGCNRVRRVNLMTGAVSPVAGNATAPLSDGLNAQVGFSALSGVTASGGLVFVSENGRVRRIDATTTRTLAGPPPRPGQVFGRDAGYIGSGGITLEGPFAYSVIPFQQLLLRTRLETGEASPVAFLQSDPMGRFPGAVAALSSSVFVAYANGNVRRVDLTRLPTDGAVPDGGVVDGPFFGRSMPAESFTSLTTDGTTLWGVSAQNRIVRLALDGGFTPVAGALGGTAVVDGVGLAAQLAGPTALTSAAGALWFLDGAMLMGRGTVLRRYELDGGRVSTVLGVAGDAQRVDGTGRVPGANDGGLLPGSARLAGGLGLAGNDTTLLIADVGQADVLSGETQGSTLRLYDIATGTLSTAVGRPGNASFVAGTGRDALVSSPTQLAWDAVRRRFVVFDRGELVFATFE